MSRRRCAGQPNRPTRAGPFGTAWPGAGARGGEGASAGRCL